MPFFPPLKRPFESVLFFARFSLFDNQKKTKNLSPMTFLKGKIVQKIEKFLRKKEKGEVCHILGGRLHTGWTIL